MLLDSIVKADWHKFTLDMILPVDSKNGQKIVADLFNNSKEHVYFDGLKVT